MSEVKVNKISPRTNCGTVTLGDSGDSFAVAACASFKTKDVKDTSGNIIISRCGSNITIGSSGAAVALAAGATQSGFGRTGTVNWDTTAKTASFTAVSGEGYFVNTTSGAITVTLPAGSAGAIVSLADYTNTWQTNNVTVTPDGSEKIGGIASSATLNTEGQSVTFIYVDATEGWKNVQDSTSNVTGNPFIVATGGTILTCGDFKTHVFTGPGTFTVTNAGAAPGSNSVEYLVVAGGASGARNDIGGAGGAGGYRQNYPSPVCAGLPVTAQAYPITVGAGGAASTTNGPVGNPGNNSIFSTITSAGGGGGGGVGGFSGLAGGSGGGAAHGGCTSIGGAGNTPPVSPPQGNPGGGGALTGPQFGGGGGGGAGAAGTSGVPSAAGPGGIGSPIATTFFGPTAPSYGTAGPAPGRYFAGGGGGAREDAGTGGTGGSGGGGAGGSSNQNAVNGTTNTGGGGGGTACQPAASGAGGSGIVIIRYKFQ
jgi:hypothetical protein